MRIFLTAYPQTFVTLCNIIAASDKQQGGHDRPAHKNPSKLKTGLEGYDIIIRA